MIRRIILFILGATVAYFGFIKDSGHEILKSFRTPEKPTNVYVQKKESPFLKKAGSNTTLSNKEKECLILLDFEKMNRPIDVDQEIKEFRKKIDRMRMQSSILYDQLSDGAKDALAKEHELLEQLPEDVQEIYRKY